MKSILALCLAVVFSASSFSAVNPEFTPQWKVGDSWSVLNRSILDYRPAISQSSKYSKRVAGPVDEILFTVLPMRTLDGRQCHVIQTQVHNPTNTEDSLGRWLLFIAKEDFTLVRVLSLRVSGIDTISRSIAVNPVIGEFYLPELASDCYVPFDFPNMPVGVFNEERTIHVPSSTQTITQRVTVIAPSIMRIELETTVGYGTYRTVQYWEKGRLWWSSIERTITRKNLATGKDTTEVEACPILMGTDKQPPQLTIKAMPDTLWPPNGKMVPVVVKIGVKDNYDPFPQVKFESISTNETDNSKGRSKSTEDYSWGGDSILSLRATRNGNGDGRIYKINYSATDASGNRSISAATVVVPHDRGDK